MTTAPEPTDQNSKAQLEALRRFVVECDHLRDLEQIIGRFNIFDVLKTTHNEIRHSNVLAWLLDPDGSHGLRELFLRRWLMQVFHDADPNDTSYIDPVAIDSAPFSSVTIHREWSHIDLLVEIETTTGRRWVICIENKVWSWQGQGQLSRYRQRVESAFPDPWEKAYVLLSVRGEEPEDASYLATTFSQVAEVLDRCLIECGPSTGEPQKLLLSHYHSILTTRFMPDSEVTRLATQIYAAHREALDIIFEHKPDVLLDLTTAVEEAMKQDAASLGIVPKWTIKGCIRFLPQSWEIPKNRVNDGWSTVICEIYLWSGKAVLKAFAGRESSLDWKKRLHAVASSSDFPNLRKRKAVPELWYTFYKVPGPSLKIEELLPDEVPEKAAEIWTAVKAEVSSPRFKKMAEQVALLLPSL